MWSRLAFVGAFLFLLADGPVALVKPAWAADPPGRVGRLSLIEGTVSLRSPQPVDADNAADTATPELKDEWSPATLNYPVTSGNSLWTESGAKAELQVGPAEVRLNEQTELEILRLDDRSVDLALHQGTANIHIGETLPGGLLIDTPRGPVTLTQPGSYRIDVDTGSDNPADTVHVTAFDGEAKVSVETPDKTDTHTVKRGQSLKLAGDPVQIALADARPTAFDEWARGRDPRAVAATRPQAATPTVGPAISPQTVSPVSTQMTGYQDLAPYGAWEPAPNYGTVWYPAAVTPDWAPYRYGHWAYVAPWGWTWIDDAPWGFTPFHYGRWVRVGPRWAWWPGHRTVRPVYAPALVAFVGGNGWSVAITSGRARPVGWVPLAPYEAYRPHYRTSATYVRNVNITTVNKTVINNITVNNNTEINRFTNRNAITAVSADNFARGRKVNEAKIDVSRKEIERAKVTTDVRAIKPAAVAVKADQPRPTAHRDDARKHDTERRPNPAITSRDQDRPDQRTGQRRDPAIERRDAAIQERGPERNQARNQRRETTPQPVQKSTEKPAQQAAPAAAPQQQRDAEQRQQHENAARDQRQRDQAQEQKRQQGEQQQRQRAEQQQRDQAQDQQRQRDVQERQQRDQADQQQRRQRDEAQDQQRREQQEQRQRRERPDQRSEQRGQPQSAQPQQAQQAAEQQRRQVQDQQRRQEADQQQRRQRAEAQQRDAQDHQRRQQAEAQQRQQAEQQQRQAHEQQRQAQDQQRRQQEAQQRQQAEQQQRQQAEQQQRAQADQQRQAQQQQQQRQQEQVREEQRRRGPDNRPDGKRDRAG